MIEMMSKSVEQKFMSRDVHRLYSVADTIDEVFEQLEGYVEFSYNKYEK